VRTRGKRRNDMIASKFCRLLIVSAIAAMVSPAFAQQASDAAKAAPATQSEINTEANTPTPADAEAAATAAAIAKANAAAAGGKSATPKPTDDAAFAKKAKDFGWHPEVRQGVTVYCREAPVIGSRFTEKKCADEARLAVILEQQEFDRDQLKQRGCGGNCGGK
jgi:hypothetical protein